MDCEVQAIILVGGLGSRLQPLTFTVPKPLIPIANVPTLERQVSALCDVGVKKIVLAMNYKYEEIVKFVKVLSKRYSVNIVTSMESFPLGTEGPIAYAKKHLIGKPFIVMNSDIICRYPLEEMIRFHTRRDKMGTILITEVDDPSRYGVVKTADGDETLVENFVEKPTNFITNVINAGIYMFNPDALDLFELRSVELEDKSHKFVPSYIEKGVLPKMASQHQLSVFHLNGFWSDVGTAEGLLFGSKCFIRDVVGEPYVIPESVRIGKDVKLVGPVVVGENTVIGEHATLSNCIIFNDTTIGRHVSIRDSIVGAHCKIGDNVTMSSATVLGDGTKIFI